MRTIRHAVHIDGLTWRVDRVSTMHMSTNYAGSQDSPFDGLEFRRDDVLIRVPMSVFELPSIDQFKAMSTTQLGVLLTRGGEVR